MWFDRKSVIYKVPNHRILELRKSWNFVQTGRRYASASYLYGNSLVCCFCSQFLSSSSDNDQVIIIYSYILLYFLYFLNLLQKSPSIVLPGPKTTQLYQTPITRKNISLGCKTYQSSEVDSHNSSNAINPPYVIGSKTRREADPWWEVDLGKTIHVHSISITIKGPTQQNVIINYSFNNLINIIIII